MVRPLLVLAEPAHGGGPAYDVALPPVLLRRGLPDEDGQLDQYDNFCAGLLELVGVDPGDWLPGVVPFRGAHPV